VPIDPALQEMIDRIAVEETFSNFLHRVDAHDWLGVRELLAEVVDQDLTSLLNTARAPGPVSGDEYAEFVKTGVSAFTATHHMSTNFVIAIAGDEATAHSKMFAYHFMDVPGLTVKFHTTRGWYDTGLRRTGAGWRISRMHIHQTTGEGSPEIYARLNFAHLPGPRALSAVPTNVS
jgi:SnoaL-like domain